MEATEPKVCQCHCVPKLSLGIIPTRPASFGSWLKLILKRNLSDSTKRKLKRFSSNLVQRFKPASKRSGAFSGVQVNSQAVPLAAGDIVRVRSEEEISATLNAWNELKGCMFMDAQRQYCGTIQRVFKPVERFVDERDYRVKKASGIYLLEGLFCQGTTTYGQCDRSCFYFWRVEWLEKINQPE